MIITKEKYRKMLRHQVEDIRRDTEDIRQELELDIRVKIGKEQGTGKEEVQSTTSVVIQIKDREVFGAILQIQEVLGNIVIQLEIRGKLQKTTTSVHTMDFNFNTKR